jgi:hypothetical protein
MTGCLKTPNYERYVGNIVSIQDLNYSEVERINRTEVKGELEKKGYTVTINEKTPSFIAITYNSSKKLQIDVSAYTEENNTTIAHLWICYYIGGEYKENASNIEMSKNFMILKGREVAEVCNITLDWSKAKWTINYVPS